MKMKKDYTKVNDNINDKGETEKENEKKRMWKDENEI